MLEAHNLRQSLHTVRQELSHALYQHDAAQRVIARLIRERDEARAALADVAARGADMANGKRAQDEEMEDAPAKRVCTLALWVSQAHSSLLVSYASLLLVLSHQP